MTYLVTGATGFIGTNIVEHLAREGERVVALSNVAPSARQKQMAARARGEVNFVLGDVRDQAGLEDVIERHGVERLIHAAVITSNAEREKTGGPLIVDVNLVGVAAAATAAANKGLKRFVFVGSVGVFAAYTLPDGMVIEESQPQRAETLYGIGKSAAELIVRRICTLNGLPYVIGRVATAFGPWEHDSGYRDTLSPIHQITRRARAGETAILGRDRKSNWHYGRDAAAALVTLAQADAPRFSDYNLGPQWIWPLSEWCARLAQRFPDFRYEIGGEGNVELHIANDGGFLSGARFTEEFGPSARFDLDDAFADFMRWLDELQTN
jgi:nucleoside-diphosphate-sugar epimerase